MTLHQYIQNCKLDIKHTKKQQRMINILFSTIEQNRVNKIKSQSLEIEGIFKDNPPNYVGDGSVSVSADQDDEGNRIQNVLGESRSDICYNDKDLKKYIRILLRKHYLKFNQSCGLHIHIRLSSDEIYKLLMSEEFYSYFLDWLDYISMKYHIRNGHRWYKRINGNEYYCQRNCLTELQFKTSSKPEERYSVYNSCFNTSRSGGKIYKTFEFRVFCMFESEQLTTKILTDFRKMITAFINCDKKLHYKSTSLERDEYWERNLDEMDYNGTWKKVPTQYKKPLAIYQHDPNNRFSMKLKKKGVKK